MRDCGILIVLCFFFQAEDGIRDLVRSRGLGDVYKRQVVRCATIRADEGAGGDLGADAGTYLCGDGGVPGPVSYTHLTLPTSDLV